jgi:hypothetical protein
LQGVSARLHNVVMDLRGEMATLTKWQLEAQRARTVAGR